MNHFLPLGKYSFGMGDRFARQGQAQLQTCLSAAAEGVEIVPVWNKSNREHVTIGSDPAQSRAAADAAVKALHWDKPYFLDADHIRLETVDRFLPHANFYTIDVADWIGKPASPEAVRRLLDRHPELTNGTVETNRAPANRARSFEFDLSFLDIKVSDGDAIA